MSSLYNQITYVVTIIMLLYCNNSYASLSLQDVDTQYIHKRIEDRCTPSSDKYSCWKLVFFFTSWCPFCKSAFINLVQDDSLSKFNIFLISLDRNSISSSNFVEKINNKYKISRDFVVYRVKNVEDMEWFFRDLDIKYSDKIPHITVLNDANEPVIDGSYSISALKSMLLRFH